jgi:hypothetical protein
MFCIFLTLRASAFGCRISSTIFWFRKLSLVGVQLLFFIYLIILGIQKMFPSIFF